MGAIVQYTIIDQGEFIQISGVIGTSVENVSFLLQKSNILKFTTNVSNDTIGISMIDNNDYWFTDSELIDLDNVIPHPSILLQSGNIIYRKTIRDGFYVIDYSANAGTTWDLSIVSLNLEENTIIRNIDSGVIGYRHLIRNGTYVIDHILNEIGFTGVEDIDWENIYAT